MTGNQSTQSPDDVRGEVGALTGALVKLANPECRRWVEMCSAVAEEYLTSASASRDRRWAATFILRLLETIAKVNRDGREQALHCSRIKLHRLRLKEIADRIRKARKAVDRNRLPTMEEIAKRLQRNREVADLAMAFYGPPVPADQPPPETRNSAR